MRIIVQTECIEKAQQASHNELRILLPKDSDSALRTSSDCESSNKGPWNGARECDVVVGLDESLIPERYAIFKYVVRCLDVEGLFDFGVGCYEEVKEDDGGDYGEESNICR